MAAFIPAIIDVAARIFDKVIPDKAAAERAKAEFFAAAQQQEFSLMLEQIKVNTAEASSTNWFVAGWRPFVGWICGAGLFYATIMVNLFSWLSTAKGWPLPPKVDTDTLLYVLGALLGIGGLRTIEKVKGVAS